MEDINTLVSAEVPDDPLDASLVREFMIHRHPPAHLPAASYCQTDHANGTRSCRFHYPFDLQNETTINDEGRIYYRRRHVGDEMVVPHCLPLLRKFRCHLNFEAASSSHLFQYLFKYIHKGL